MMLFALQYLRQGYSVIPLKPRSKEPLIPWQEFQKRKATESEVKGWFTRWPSANVGIVTGQISGVAIVDLDGPEGIAEGQRLGFTSPLLSLTGKGRQLFYKHTGGNICNAVRKYPGIDIRGDGGYVVAPPSIHPNGRRYQWVGASAAALKNHLPNFPVSVFTATSAPTTLVGKPEGWIATALAEMKQGNIDNTLHRVCSRLRADGYSKTDAKMLLEPHAIRAGATPGHLDDKIANAWARYEPNVRVESAQETPNAESIDSFMEALTPVDWICAPLIAKGTLVFVAGLPETNKTWLLMDLALECAATAHDGLGHKWLGLFPVQHSRVLFIDQERFKGETQRRLRAVAREKNIDFKDIKDNLFIRCGTTTRLDITASYEAFRRELLEIKPDLVLIDSWAAFQSTDENNRQSVQVVLERIKALRTEIGCTFIFIDHDGKGAFGEGENQENPSYRYQVGSIAKPAAAETIFTVRRFDSDSVLVHHTKSTLAATAKSFVVKVIDTEHGVKVVGQGDK
jgi:hypothetical protein